MPSRFTMPMTKALHMRFQQWHDSYKKSGQTYPKFAKSVGEDVNEVKFQIQWIDAAQKGLRKAEIYKRYFDERVPLADIEAEFGIHRTALNKWLKKDGLSTREGQHNFIDQATAEEWKTVALTYPHESIYSVCERVIGHPYQTVRKAWLRAGIDVGQINTERINMCKDAYVQFYQADIKCTISKVVAKFNVDRKVVIETLRERNIARHPFEGIDLSPDRLDHIYLELFVFKDGVVRLKYGRAFDLHQRYVNVKDVEYHEVLQVWDSVYELMQPVEREVLKIFQGLIRADQPGFTGKTELFYPVKQIAVALEKATDEMFFQLYSKLEDNVLETPFQKAGNLNLKPLEGKDVKRWKFPEEIKGEHTFSSQKVERQYLDMIESAERKIAGLSDIHTVVERVAKRRAKGKRPAKRISEEDTPLVSYTSETDVSTSNTSDVTTQGNTLVLGNLSQLYDGQRFNLFVSHLTFNVNDSMVESEVSLRAKAIELGLIGYDSEWQLRRSILFGSIHYDLVIVSFQWGKSLLRWVARSFQASSQQNIVGNFSQQHEGEKPCIEPSPTPCLRSGPRSSQEPMEKVHVATRPMDSNTLVSSTPVASVTLTREHFTVDGMHSICEIIFKPLYHGVIVILHLPYYLPLREIGFIWTLGYLGFALSYNLIHPNKQKPIPWVGLAWLATWLSYRLNFSSLACIAIFPSVLLLGTFCHKQKNTPLGLMPLQATWFIGTWLVGFALPLVYPNITLNKVYLFVAKGLSVVLDVRFTQGLILIAIRMLPKAIGAGSTRMKNSFESKPSFYAILVYKIHAEK